MCAKRLVVLLALSVVVPAQVRAEPLDFRKCLAPILNTLGVAGPFPIGVHVQSPDYFGPSPKLVFESIPPLASKASEFAKVVQVVDYANLQFTRRGWPDQFLQERQKIARLYAGQSSYIVVRENNLGSKILGTVGYSTSSSVHEQLPMEYTHGWKLPRPPHGPILELRTFAMDEDPKISERVFPQLFSWVIERVNQELVGVPSSSFGDKLIYTYGDPVSERMYRKMGFEVATDLAPVQHDGVTWRVLRVSPQRLTENYQRFAVQGVHIYPYRDGDTFLLAWSDGTLVPVKRIYLNLNSHLDGPNSKFQLTKDLELWRGAKVKAGSFVDFYGDTGGIKSIEQGFESVTEILPGLSVAPHTLISWTQSGEVSNAVLARPANLDGGRLHAAAGSRIALAPKYVYVDRLSSDVEVLPGIFASSGKWIKKRTERNGRFGIYFYLKDTIEPALGIKIVKGSIVHLEVIGPHHFVLVSVKEKGVKRDLNREIFMAQDLTPFTEIHEHFQN